MSNFRMFIDEKGIPISDYGYYNGVYIGKQRSIVAVAEKGLDYWNQYLLTDKSNKVLLSYDWEKFPENRENLPNNLIEAQRMFLNCANWLIEHALSRGNYIIWKYSYSFAYNTKAGWRSSQAQAVGMQLLMRAYEFTGDSKYLNFAKRSLRAFYVSVKDGGITDKELSQGWWYDKFADVECKKPKVLNGMMFALLGIHDFYERKKDKNTKFLFDNGIIALKHSLPKYDAGNWSYYDRLGRLASRHYHEIHIHQLKLLYKITKESIFEKYYEKFKEYLSLDTSRG